MLSIEEKLNPYSRLVMFDRTIPDIYEAITINPPFSDFRGTVRHQDFAFEMRWALRWQPFIIEELSRA